MIRFTVMKLLIDTKETMKNWTTALLLQKTGSNRESDDLSRLRAMVHVLEMRFYRLKKYLAKV